MAVTNWPTAYSKTSPRVNTLVAAIPFLPSPLSLLPPCSLRVYTDLHCRFFFVHPSRFTANLPRATGNFPRPNGERIPRMSFHKKQFRGEILPDTLYFLVTMLSISWGNSIWMNQFEFYKVLLFVCVSLMRVSRRDTMFDSWRWLN